MHTWHKYFKMIRTYCG